jgi:hypothetical protein
MSIQLGSMRSRFTPGEERRRLAKVKRHRKAALLAYIPEPPKAKHKKRPHLTFADLRRRAFARWDAAKEEATAKAPSMICRACSQPAVGILNDMPLCAACLEQEVAGPSTDAGSEIVTEAVPEPEPPAEAVQETVIEKVA